MQDEDGKTIFAGTLILPTSIFEYEVDPIRIRFQAFEFDIESGELWKDSASVKLQPQPAKVLRLLVERAGNLVSREDIQKALWESETFVDFDQGLNYCIRQIRIALEDNTEQPLFIATIPRRGYRFVAEVSIVAAAPSALSSSLQNASRAVEPTEFKSPPSTLPSDANLLPPEIKARRWEISQVAIGVFSLLLLGGLIYFGAWRRHLVKASMNADSAASAENASVPLRTSVAVLGFANLGGTEKDSWLSTALAEMLSTELSEGGKLRLISGEEVAKAKRSLPQPESLSRETLSHLRQQLGTDVIVLGSYAILPQHHARLIRLDLRLQDARDGRVLAAFAQTGVEADLFRLVASSGAKLRQKLGAQALSATEEASFDRSFPTDPDARRLYAEGLDKLRRSDTSGARESLEEVTKLEPRFAPGHSTLAAAWSTLGYDEKAAEEAKKATELSGNLSREEQLSIEARYYEIAENRPKAVETLRTLLSFFPDNIDYGIRLANVHMLASQNNEALSTVAQLRKLPDPLGDSPRLDLLEAQIHSRAGDFRQARSLAEEAVRKGRAADAQLFIAQALLSKAFILERLALPDESLRASAEARQINTDSNFPRGIAVSLMITGDVLYDKGEFVGARERFENALSFFREIGDKRNLGLTLERIGNTYHDQGKFAESQNDYQHALDIYREIQWASGISSATGNLANTLDSLGDLKGSMKMHQEALQIFQQTGQKRGTASEIDNIANVYVEMGDLSSAADSYRKSIALHRETGYQRGEMYALSGFGDVFLLQNNLDAARKQYEAARILADKGQEKNDVARMDVALATIDFYQGRLSEAEALVRRATIQFQTDKDPDSSASANALLTRILLMQQKKSEAVTAGRQAESFAGQITAFPPQFDVGLALAHLEAATGKKEQARKRLLPLLERSSKSGYVQYNLEIRRVLIGMEVGNTRSGHLNSLATEAKQRGFGLIAAEVAKMPGQAI